MTKVILFDLDGTLLPMDTDVFVKSYVKELSQSVAHIIDANLFIKALFAGTEAMMRNVNANETNEEVFTKTFLKILKIKKEQIWPTIDKFYEKTFPRLSYLCQPTPMARQVVKKAIQRGYRVAIATNPVFPKVAINHRIKWAGLDDISFEIVTDYEQSVFTKPHNQYYQNICDRLDVSPEECIMVGNDKQEDMVASQIGLKTFLLEGNVIDRGKTYYHIDDRGTIEELIEKLTNHKGLFKQ